MLALKPFYRALNIHFYNVHTMPFYSAIDATQQQLMQRSFFL